MNDSVPKKALNMLLRRFGSKPGSVPIMAVFGLRDALEGVPLHGCAR